LTIVKSADPSTEAIGPNAVAGRSSSGAVRPVKCTSPANAKVNGPPEGAADEGAAAEGAADEETADETGAGWNVGSGVAAHPDTAATSANTKPSRTFTAPAPYTRGDR